MWQKVDERDLLDPKKTKHDKKPRGTSYVELEPIKSTSDPMVRLLSSEIQQQQGYRSIETLDKATNPLRCWELSESKLILWNSFIHYQNLLFVPLIFQAVEPSPKGWSHSAKIFFHKMMQSLQFTFGKVWPLIFYLTLVVDLNNSNLNLTSDWGSDVPGDKEFKSAFFLMLALPFIAAWAWSLPHTLMWSNEFVEKDDALAGYSGTESFLTLYTDVRRLEWELLWNSNLPSVLHQSVLNKVNLLTSDPNLIVRYRAVKALANIARDFSEDNALTINNNNHEESIDEQALERVNINNNNHEKSIDEQALERLNINNNNHEESIDEQALERLNNFIRRPNSGFIKFYAHYKLWHIGKSKYKAAHLFEIGFMITLGLQLAAFIHYVKVLIKKSVALSKFNNNENNCENDHKLWRYVTEIGNYDCLVCDFSSVYYLDRNSSQSCLDGYLALPHIDNDVLKIFKQMSSHPDYKKIDFSHQDWPNWSNFVFESIFAEIDKSIDRIDGFDLSTSDYMPWSQDETKIKILTNFFQKVTAKKVDLHNRGFGAEIIKTLMSGINGTATEFVDITSTNAQDAGVIAASSIVPSSHIATLRIGGNGMTDVGLGEVTSNVKNSTLTDLDISNNSFREEGFDAFTQGLPFTRIEKFDASNNNLGFADFYQLGLSLRQSKLTAMTLENTNTADDQVVELSEGIRGSSLESINLSNNPGIGDLGATSLITNAVNSTITEVNLSGTSWTEMGLSDSAILLPTTPIENLAMANIQSNAKGFCQIMNVLNNTQIESVDIDENQVGNDIAPCLIQAITNPNSKLRTLKISRLNMDEATLINIINALPNSTINALYLMGDGITNTGASALATVLPHTRLKVLVISDNSIGSEGAKELAKNFRQLEIFILNGNPIGPVGAEDIIKAFIDVPKGVSLGAPKLSRSQYRALNKANKNPLTSIKQMGLENTGLKDKEVRELCQIWASTNAPLTDANLKDNPTEDIQVDPLNCATSSSSQLRPWLSSIYQYIQLTVEKVKSTLSSSLSRFNIQSHSSQEYDQQKLKHCNFMLNELKKRHDNQKQSRAAHFEPLWEKFQLIAELHDETTKMIMNADLNPRLLSDKISKIEKNLQSMQQMVSELSSANKALHHIHVKEQRLQRRAERTHQSVESLVHYDHPTSNISHQVVKRIATYEEAIRKPDSQGYESNCASFWYVDSMPKTASFAELNVNQCLSLK